jgi:hypothetical protein
MNGRNIVQLNAADLAAMQALIHEYHLLAADVTEQHGASFLHNVEAPTRYDGNHVRRIRGDIDIDALFAAVEEHYAHLPYRAVRVDPYTPLAVEARLLLDEYECSIEIVMAADGALGGGHRASHRPLRLGCAGAHRCCRGRIRLGPRVAGGQRGLA